MKVNRSSFPYGVIPGARAQHPSPESVTTALEALMPPARSDGMKVRDGGVPPPSTHTTTRRGGAQNALPPGYG